jgi:hypothetical protein
LRWEDGVAQDMQILGVKRWKNVALNRDEWAKLLKKARVHQGLSSQWYIYIYTYINIHTHTHTQNTHTHTRVNKICSNCLQVSRIIWLRTCIAAKQFSNGTLRYDVFTKTILRIQVLWPVTVYRKGYRHPTFRIHLRWSTNHDGKYGTFFRNVGNK